MGGGRAGPVMGRRFPPLRSALPSAPADTQPFASSARRRQCQQHAHNPQQLCHWGISRGGRMGRRGHRGEDDDDGRWGRGREGGALRRPTEGRRCEHETCNAATELNAAEYATRQHAACNTAKCKVRHICAVFAWARRDAAPILATLVCRILAQRSRALGEESRRRDNSIGSSPRRRRGEE